MTKKIIILVIMLMIISISPFAQAHSNDKIESIFIEVEVRENGSAVVEERWIVNSMERYSYYKAFLNDQITNFSVKEGNTEYSFLSNWDLSMPYEEKVNHYGIIQTEDGLELCWGVEKDGFHQYIIQYEIPNFIHQYTDCQGTQICFLKQGMNPIPGFVNITLRFSDKIRMKISNYGSQTEEKWQDEKTLVIDVKNPALGLTTFIQISEGAGFKPEKRIEQSFKKIQKEMDIQNGNALGRSDKLVLTTLIIVTICYLFCDIYREIYHYLKRNRK